MKNGPLVFLSAFFALSASWCGFVLAPQLQLGRQQPQTNIVNTAELYPQMRPGSAREGLQVYRANGCAYCHSLQVGQTGMAAIVVLTDVGTNPVAVAEALLKSSPGAAKINPAGLNGDLPKTVLQGVTLKVADAAVKAITAAGAKAQRHVVAVGPDIARGWGRRRTVADDFLFDDPVMPGSQRIGPDLANVGVRQPDANWQLRHLYAPQTEVNGSTMPPMRFLFEQRRIQQQSSPDALALPEDYAPPPGYEIVPKPEARALVAYLLSLRADTPLFEAPMTAMSASPVQTSTNAPAAPAAPTGTNAIKQPL